MKDKSKRPKVDSGSGESDSAESVGHNPNVEPRAFASPPCYLEEFADWDDADDEQD